MIKSELIALIRAGETRGVSFVGVDLRGANLERSGLSLANEDFTNANLRGARLNWVWMPHIKLNSVLADDAQFQNANLASAVLSYASLCRANFAGATLTNALLNNTDLYLACFNGALLNRANFYTANLAWASMQRAQMQGARLEHANLHGADLRGAELVSANLEGANLENAILIDANLTNANLEHANLDGANLTGADLTGTILDKYTPISKTALGKQGRAVSRMQQFATAQEYKSVFPVEYAVLAQWIAGRKITPELIAAAINKFGVEWQVSFSRWEGMQRVGDEPDDVMQLSLLLSSLTTDLNELDVLAKIRETSIRSGHPVVKGHSNVFTVGWSRYVTHDAAKVILIEEVQSDTQIVRRNIKDPALRQQFEDAGFDLERVNAVLALLEPFAKRFYQDAIDLVFDLARQQGFEVEMLMYPAKKAISGSPPRNVYDDLPRQMQMRPALSKVYGVLPGQSEPLVWRVVPNKRRQ